MQDIIDNFIKEIINLAYEVEGYSQDGLYDFICNYYLVHTFLTSVIF